MPLRTISVMGANNETGVLMPLAELAGLAHAAGALMHADATQLIGKTPFLFAGCGADLVSVSAHKLHGPKGVGALIVRKGIALPALLAGRQERKRRGGTENTPGIAGFAAACERAARTLSADLEHVSRLRQRLEEGLRHGLPGLHLYGEQASRLSNTCCVRFGELDSELVLGRLERAGVVASSGAACSAGWQPRKLATRWRASASIRRARCPGSCVDEGLAQPLCSASTISSMASGATADASAWCCPASNTPPCSAWPPGCAPKPCPST